MGYVDFNGLQNHTSTLRALADAKYETLDNVKSKGSVLRPIYFDSNGVAQPTSYDLALTSAASVATPGLMPGFTTTAVNSDKKRFLGIMPNATTAHWGSTDYLADTASAGLVPSLPIEDNVGMLSSYLMWNAYTASYQWVTPYRLIEDMQEAYLEQPGLQSEFLPSTTAPGLLRPITNSTTRYLRADGTWAAIPNATTATQGLLTTEQFSELHHFFGEQAITDLNNVTKSGIYFYSSSSTNKPTNAQGSLLVLGRGGSSVYVVQVAFVHLSSGEARPYIRIRYNSSNQTWSDWMRVTTTTT